uniref:Probable glycine dehydrogenase (decarboxylating) subunit 1 n=1 Tax=candidate division WOR-3 bacterium TaxID=2052148 RepID=A0A7C4YCZ9_UNCW3
MHYIPVNEKEREEMLKLIGASIEEIFSTIPENLRFKGKLPLPQGISEIEVRRIFKELSAKNKELVIFAGLGAYDHYIPSVIDSIISRPEFYTAYTPYQPEVSQGTLRAIYEYQSMICELTKMDVSNASIYDGATALAEAVWMAFSITGKNKVFLSKGVNPLYIEVIKTYSQFLELKFLDLDENGRTMIEENMIDDRTSCLVIQNPNFLGIIEDVFRIEEIVHKKNALFVVSFDPISLGILVPPGDYNADIATAEGQSLGLPLNFGGPYLGIFTSKKDYIRFMPGRIIGKTQDVEGKTGFVMTLQTREQHIRREKATSNICTNQQLCALTAAIYLALMGKEGIREVANQSLQKAHYLAETLEKSGIKMVFKSSFFREFVVNVPELDKKYKECLKEDILPGVKLSRFNKEWKDYLLIAVTEKRTKEEMDKLASILSTS